MKVITIEEHVLNPAVAKASAATAQQLNPHWSAAFSPDTGLPYTPSPDVLTDLDEGRLAAVITRPTCGSREAARDRRKCPGFWLTMTTDAKSLPGSGSDVTSLAPTGRDGTLEWAFPA